MLTQAAGVGARLGVFDLLEQQPRSAAELGELTQSDARAMRRLLRALECPVKIRYSAGKREGMGCGQLSADTESMNVAAVSAEASHMAAPPGIFTG